MLLAVFLFGVCGVAAAPASHHGPAWEDAGPAPHDAVHRLVFAMKAPEAQAAAFAEAVAARTGADHAARAAPLTLAELGKYVRPEPMYTRAVRTWLHDTVRALDVQETLNGDFVVATVTVGHLSAALGLEPFHRFKHLRSGRHVVRGLAAFACSLACLLACSLACSLARFACLLARLLCSLLAASQPRARVCCSSCQPRWRLRWTLYLGCATFLGARRGGRRRQRRQRRRQRAGVMRRASTV